MLAVYDRFVSRVSQGRGLSPEEVDGVGRGRVWTGEQGVENGLVVVHWDAAEPIGPEEEWVNSGKF